MSKVTILPEDTTVDDLRDLSFEGRPDYIPFIMEGKTTSSAEWMFRRDTLFGTVMTHSKDGPSKGLPTWPFGGFLKRNETKIPAEFISMAHGFFQATFKRLKTEAAVLICLDWDDEWHIFAPPQENSGGGVHYEVDATKDLPGDWTIVGSIHSHCDFSAFHSGVDSHDADKNDGLHITLGHVDRDIAEVDVMFSFSGIQWDRWSLEDVISGPQPPAGDYPAEWDESVSVFVPKAKVTNATNTSVGNWKPLLSDDELDGYINNIHDIEQWNSKVRQDRFTLRLSDYRFGLQETSARLLKGDLEMFATYLALSGIKLEFNVSTSNLPAAGKNQKKGQRAAKG